MVDVAVTEHHRIDFRRVKREGLPVALLLLSPPLNQPAVQQNLVAVAAQDMTGAGYPGRGAVKLQFHVQYLRAVVNLYSISFLVLFQYDIAAYS
jgi:hypothetical protein